MSEKAKVAILGGGVGSMTAAFALSATPALRERFEITVHQIGWRLGGKGASGRNAAAGQRIEEHGLHVWFGFYEHAFRVMRAAYEELGRPPGSPLATLEDAFHPADKIVLYDHLDAGWHEQAFCFPRNPLRPGDGEELPRFWALALAGVQWARAAHGQLCERAPELATAAVAPHHTPSWFAVLARDLHRDEIKAREEGGEHLLALAHAVAQARVAHSDPQSAEHVRHRHLFADLLCHFRDWLWEHVERPRQGRDPLLKTLFTTLDVFASTVHGIVYDGVLEHGFSVIDDREWSAWLAANGAKPVTIGARPAERAPVLRAVYDVAFGYPGGVIDNADVAAGTATNDLLRLALTYRGAVMWKMQAGMGDTVFTPFYEVLRKRGVRFEFFSAVSALRTDAGGKRVAEIDVVTQARVRGGSYDPLVEVNGLRCWPSAPCGDRLDEPAWPPGAAPDFEGALDPLGRGARTLRVGEDFDAVVLGISVGALPAICADLAAADERFARALGSAVTVSTQAFQLWMRRPSADLGWKHGDDSVAGCYVEPLDTYCDMDHLLVREAWAPDDEVAAIAYFCGVLEEIEGETQAAATARAKAGALAFLRRDLGPIWPAAVDGGGCVDWSLLCAPPGSEGEQRFDAQYWRANIAGTERYVLTPHGTVAERLPSADTGFENLVAAGDWTRNGINGGCVEAAVISGLQAARGLIGHGEPLIGEDEAWLSPQ